MTMLRLGTVMTDTFIWDVDECLAKGSGPSILDMVACNHSYFPSCYSNMVALNSGNTGLGPQMTVHHNSTGQLRNAVGCSSLSGRDLQPWSSSYLTESILLRAQLQLT